jgi:hypothetical protein
MIEDDTPLWMPGRAPDQPIRMAGATREVEIGQGILGVARRAWEKLLPVP